MIGAQTARQPCTCISERKKVWEIKWGDTLSQCVSRVYEALLWPSPLHIANSSALIGRM